MSPTPSTAGRLLRTAGRALLAALYAMGSGMAMYGDMTAMMARRGMDGERPVPGPLPGPWSGPLPGPRSGSWPGEDGR